MKLLLPSQLVIATPLEEVLGQPFLETDISEIARK